MMNEHPHIYNRQNRTQIQFLEQLTDQEFWDYAQSLAAEEAVAATTDEEYLECDIEQGHCLLLLHTLCEVVPPPHNLTLLPLRPAWMLGITVWRGYVVPVVDLASYFAFHETDDTDTIQHAYPRSNSMLLILEDGNTFLGIQVVAVGSVVTLGRAQLDSAEQAPSWYPRNLLPTLLGTYHGSVILNSQMLIAEMMQHIKVTATYE